MGSVAWLLGVTLQVVSVLILLELRPVHPGWGGAAHVLGALAWGWGAGRSGWARGAAGGWLAGTMALLLPGAGWLISAVTLGLLRARPPKSRGRPMIVWSERAVRSAGGLRPVTGTRASVAEILRSPDAEARRHAILALKDLETRAALPLLRKGLQDSDEQVRIYAQNTLSGLMEKFESGIKEFEQRVAESPTEVAVMVGLAEQYFELVYLDVAGDEETSMHLLAKAVALIERAAEHAPADGRIALLRLRYALRQRDVAGAKVALNRLQRLGADRQMVLPWQIELAFQQSHWTEVRELARTFLAEGWVNPRVEALARFWTKGVTA